MQVLDKVPVIGTQTKKALLIFPGGGLCYVSDGRFLLQIRTDSRFDDDSAQAHKFIVSKAILFQLQSVLG